MRLAVILDIFIFSIFRLFFPACDSDLRLKDVTRRYAKQFMTHTRKQRTEEKWLRGALDPFQPLDAGADAREDQALSKILEDVPMPTTVGAFKNHPLYALPRHLLKVKELT